MSTKDILAIAKIAIIGLVVYVAIVALLAYLAKDALASAAKSVSDELSKAWDSSTQAVSDYWNATEVPSESSPIPGSNLHGFSGPEQSVSVNTAQAVEGGGFGGGGGGAF